MKIIMYIIVIFILIIYLSLWGFILFDITHYITFWFVLIFGLLCGYTVDKIIITFEKWFMSHIK